MFGRRKEQYYKLKIQIPKRVYQDLKDDCVMNCVSRKTSVTDAIESMIMEYHRMTETEEEN